MAVDARLGEFRELRRVARLSAERSRSAGSGSGPTGTDIERRLTVLEADVKDVKASLVDIKVTLARLEALLTAMTTRIERVEADVKGALTLSIGKAIGPAQFVAIIASSLAVFGAAATVWRWLARQPWF